MTNDAFTPAGPAVTVRAAAATAPGAYQIAGDAVRFSFSIPQAASTAAPAVAIPQRQAAEAGPAPTSRPDPRIKTAVGPTILLASGHYFDLLDPEASRFTLGDIAQGLGNACRFAGQCRKFYSVAEHCWHASRLVPDHLALAALMHDASEAFIGDITRPLKSCLPEYRVIEKRIERVIAERFGLGELCDDPAVKKVDIAMLAAEQRHLMPKHDDEWPILAGVDVPAISFRNWAPAEAAAHWLERAERLINLFPAGDIERVRRD